MNTDRLTDLFRELTAIDNSSLNEAGMCSIIKEKLSALGISYEEDDAGAKIGGNCGNLYAYIEGSVPLPPILLSAHMDAVEPAAGKKAVFHPDGRITSDGTTVLGADDISGICAILEAVTSIKESGAAHRPVELLFDVSEETYCTGVEQFDFSKMKAKEAYVLDLSGPVGRAAYQAPSILSFRGVFHGKSAHAAFSPEDGIHAIKAAADAVASIECGYVGDTTVNVGTITGGSADNVVPESCTVTGEVRSFSDESARKQVAHIKEIMEASAKRLGATVDFETETFCVAYKVEPTHPVAVRFQKACAELGLSGELVKTYGGSDNNPFFHHGIRGIVAAPGMNNCHSCEEYTSVQELERATKLVEALILSGE